MSESHVTYKNFVAGLTQVGLNLCASFRLGELPAVIMDSLPSKAEELYCSLLLVGAKGGDFWQYLQTVDEVEEHPFNTVSQRVTVKILRSSYPGMRIKFLYPGTEYTIPLQQLGRLAGWGRPSMLGLDIHGEYGTWFAYRNALLVSEPLPATRQAAAAPVCEVCIEKSCRSACPVKAVKSFGSFNITACTDHRVERKSGCEDKCLSRLACPVGRESRYCTDQLAHHSRFSLASIKRYKVNNKW